MLASAAVLPLCGAPLARAADFAISVSWCGAASPRIDLSNVPKGTARLDARMVDLMVPSYRHGGGRLDYRGEASIPCGALGGSFRGPSPPPGEVHDYQWTVGALDAAGKVIGVAKTVKKFPQ